nr:hypothetical protein [Candidatus Sigynarchaeum springense]
MKKIELIRGSYGANKIHHITSTDEREVNIPKGKSFVEFLAYVETYINENGFTIKTMDKERYGLFILIEKEE